MMNLSALLPPGPDDTGGPVFPFATVTDDDPLAVRVDGDSTPVPAPPVSLVAGLEVGDRVLTLMVNRALIVVGRVGGTAVPEAEPPAWTTPSLPNNWSGVSGYVRLRYRLLGDEVAIEGSVKNGYVGVTSITLFTLPVGSRPPDDIIVPGWDPDNNNARLLVQADGAVIYQTDYALAGQEFFCSVRFGVA